LNEKLIAKLNKILGTRPTGGSVVGQHIEHELVKAEAVQVLVASPGLAIVSSCESIPSTAKFLEDRLRSSGWRSAGAQTDRG